MAMTYKVQAQYPATTQAITTAYVSNAVIATNLATITTAANHGITQVGTMVQIRGASTTVDGTYLVHSIPTGTSITFVSSTATLSSTSFSPNAVMTIYPVTSGFTISNKVTVNGQSTITTGSAHGFSIGDYVLINIGDSNYDVVAATPTQIIGVPSTTTFVVAGRTTTAASTAVTQGVVAKTTWQSSYTNSTLGAVSSTLYFSNNSPYMQTFRIAVRAGGGALANQYIAYDQQLQPNATSAWTTGLAVNNGEIITLQASSNQVVATLDGSELS